MSSLTRRILLGCVALALACYYLLTELPVDRAEFFGFITASLMLVVVAVVAAFAAAGLMRLVRRWMKR